MWQLVITSKENWSILWLSNSTPRYRTNGNAEIHIFKKKHVQDCSYSLIHNYLKWETTHIYINVQWIICNVLIQWNTKPQWEMNATYSGMIALTNIMLNKRNQEFRLKIPFILSIRLAKLFYGVISRIVVALAGGWWLKKGCKRVLPGAGNTQFLDLGGGLTVCSVCGNWVDI